MISLHAAKKLVRAGDEEEDDFDMADHLFEYLQRSATAMKSL